MVPFTAAEVKEGDDSTPGVQDRGVRDYRITVKMIERFGYMVGCPKCDAMRDQDPFTESKRHDEKCRNRLTEEMKNDDEFRVTVERAGQRSDANVKKSEEREKGNIIKEHFYSYSGNEWR